MISWCWSDNDHHDTIVKALSWYHDAQVTFIIIIVKVLPWYHIIILWHVTLFIWTTMNYHHHLLYPLSYCIYELECTVLILNVSYHLLYIHTVYWYWNALYWYPYWKVSYLIPFFFYFYLARLVHLGQESNNKVIHDRLVGDRPNHAIHRGSSFLGKLMVCQRIVCLSNHSRDHHKNHIKSYINHIKPYINHIKSYIKHIKPYKTI